MITWEEKMQALKKAREKKPPKVKKPLRHKSLKKQAEEKEQSELNHTGDTLLDTWFINRRKEMTGKCQFCGCPTEKNNPETYRRSIAHLFPKRENQFPSIALHKDNWLELCFYGNSCHTNFDNGIITWELLKDSKEWELIVTKFKKIYPSIEESEKRNIPELLLKELDSK